MSLNQFIMIFRSRWRLAAVSFGGVLCLVGFYLIFAHRQYTATASVVIDLKSDPVSPTGFTDGLLASYVVTQADVIASERVAQRAVKAIKLDQMPRMQEAWREKTGGQGDITVWIADYLLENKVSVGTGKTKNGNVISISVKWNDPQTAADLANAFAQAAIETNIELKIEPAKQFAKWFDQHSQALRANLEAKQKRLSDFENATGIVATDEKLDVENARLTELSTQLVEMQGQRQDSQSRQRQVSGDNETLPEVLSSPVIATLKSALSDAEAKQADLAGQLGKNHPDYKAAAAEVANLRERIHEEANKIASGLGVNSQISIRKENDVRAALEQQKKKVLQLKHDHDEAAVLESDVATAQRDLDAVTQRFAQSSLESQEQQTNMVQLTTAAVPFEPSSPKILLSLIAGIFFGGVFSVAAVLIAEKRDPRIRGEADLSQLLGIPTLVKISAVRFGKASKKNGLQSQQRLEPSAT
jgi:chain length determinant protein EpsF